MPSRYHNFTRFKFTSTCCHTFTILHDSNSHRHAVTLSQLYTSQIHTNRPSHCLKFTYSNSLRHAVKPFRHVILISSSYFNFTHYLKITLSHTHTVTLYIQHHDVATLRCVKFWSRDGTLLVNLFVCCLTPLENILPVRRRRYFRLWDANHRSTCMYYAYKALVRGNLYSAAPADLTRDLNFSTFNQRTVPFSPSGRTYLTPYTNGIFRVETYIKPYLRLWPFPYTNAIRIPHSVRKKHF